MVLSLEELNIMGLLTRLKSASKGNVYHVNYVK